MANLVSRATTIDTILKSFACERNAAWEHVAQGSATDGANFDYYSEHSFYGRSPAHSVTDAFEEIEEAEAILIRQQEETCWAMKEILGF
ncbi:hypothetical protein [Methylocaldum szegediense]|uniref:hypothetical protein n=1 Tax=Methylocaldum szegediense TaxID=73780 RepID=UPI000413A918|nr:hypothetical protein [Methylocaldum szegediense]